jgi:hypothetical protein
MKRDAGRLPLRIGILATILLCAGSCVTQSVQRKALEVVPLTSPVAQPGASVLLRFDEFLPGKPLNETVWDNYRGAFWDPHESRLIGFTQNYRPLDYLAGNVNPVEMVKTQMVIPFGRLLAETLESTLKNSSVRPSVCFEHACAEGPTDGARSPGILAVRVVNFRVWEEPLDHINLYAKVGLRLTGPASGTALSRDFEEWKLEARVGDAYTRHAEALRSINRIANSFIGALVGDMLRWSEGAMKSKPQAAGGHP